MESPPFFWVKQIAQELLELNTIPLFGHAAPLDWEQLSSQLSASLNTSVKIAPTHQQWKEGADIKKGLGANPHIISVTVMPLGLPIFWGMSRTDVDKLTSHLLYGKGKGKTSEVVKEGFYRYLLLNVLGAIYSLEPLQNMTLELDEETLFSEERCFAIDLEIAFEERTCLGTLLISPAFRNKWIEHFAHNQSEYFSQKIAHQTELLLGLKIGETTLLQSQWEEFEKGDCLLLDKASYHPKKNKNKASMNLNGIPLFQVAIQDNQIEILDYTLTQEEPMELDDNDLPYSEADEEITSLKDVPVTVTIELTRLKMSLDRLMNLSPGNLLDLSLSPEQGVSLCIQGKKVASGELVYLGEVLAVRILKI